MDDQQEVPRILVSGRPAGLEDDTDTPEFTATNSTSISCGCDLDSPAVPDEAPECLEDDPVFQAFVTWLDRRGKHRPRCSRTLQPPDDPGRCQPTMSTKVGVQAATPVLTSPLSDETALSTAVTSLTISVGTLTATLEALRQPSLQQPAPTSRRHHRPRCFTCGRYGHVPFVCPQRSPAARVLDSVWFGKNEWCEKPNRYK